MWLKKLLTIIVYTFVTLLIGRNLLFLPKIPQLYNSSNAYTLSLIKTRIHNLVSTKPGQYSVYVEDLTSPLSFGINEQTVFTGASVNKVPIIAVLYYLANKGKIDLDRKIVLQQSDIQDYGTGSMRYQKPGTVYSVKTLAKLTLQESDNTAAHILANSIGMPTIQNMINSWGLLQTDMANNKTSLMDMAKLYKKIYTGNVTSPALTKELLDFMKDTDNEKRLPEKLPESTIVYHKTGDAVGNVHDVGIVTANGKMYFIGVLTADVGGHEDETAATIATISKIVYDFMTNQG
jgi:beta-lactamase class A